MVIKLKYGNTNTFLIRGNGGSILVDTDTAGTLPAFYKAIKENGIQVNDITYVIATHFHPDHMGIIGDLMEQGVRLILLKSQPGLVHFSDDIFNKDRNLNFKPIDESKATVIAFGESRAFLHQLGIEGEIISTPSHSRDSISILLDDGTALVGDLDPYNFIAAYGDNWELEADWDNVLRNGPRMVFYGHMKEQQVTGRS